MTNIEKAVELMRQDRNLDALNILRYMQQYESPDDPHMLLNTSLILLKLLKYSEGFLLYEVRNRVHNIPHIQMNRWQKQTNCSLFVQMELGIGDQIQMMRYIPILQQNNIKVYWQTPTILKRFVEHNFPSVSIVQSEIPKTNYYIPSFSIPTLIHQLYPAPYCTNYKHKKSKKIGIVWKGNPKFGKDHLRSMKLEELIPIMETHQCVSLQVPITEQEKELLLKYNVELPELNDIQDTANIIAGLDKVVTVDTSVAHIAGAMGKETIVMIYFCNDWRWGEKPVVGSKSFWYNSIKVVRQQDPRTWKDVIKNVGEFLK